MKRQFLLSMPSIFPVPAYRSTEGINTSNLTLNTASSTASTLEDSTIVSQYTDEKEGAKERVRYNRTARGYCNKRLPGGRVCLKRTFFFQWM